MSFGGLIPLMVICPACTAEHPHDQPCCVPDDDPAQLRIAQLEHELRGRDRIIADLYPAAERAETEAARLRHRVAELEAQIADRTWNRPREAAS